MSTNDVPGAVAANRDELAMGCWAEAPDGSLIIVESTEGARVVFSVFDLKPTPPVEYRAALPEATFKTKFSWTAGKGGATDKWTWHDKTPFDWDRVIKAGFSEGEKTAFASDQLSAAQRVARSLEDLGIAVSQQSGRDHSHRADQTGDRDVSAVIMGKLARALNELLK